MRGSRILADKLLSLGALEICERGVYNASNSELPGEVAQTWLNEIVLPELIVDAAETVDEPIQGVSS